MAATLRAHRLAEPALVQLSLPTIRLLVLEEFVTDTDPVRRQLRDAGYEVLVKSATNTTAFKKLAREFRPDVVLLGDSLSRLDPRTALEILREVRPASALILLANELDDQSIVRYLRQGAEDVVLRRNVTLLCAAIDAAIDVRVGVRRLSPRQLEIVRLVAEGWTAKEIAQQLGIAVKTVEAHRHAVSKRIGLSTAATLTRLAVRVGLVPAADPTD
jgi:two-component system, NarL family, response regulator NreC